MRTRQLLLVALLAGIASPSQAGHHRWDFTEIFSNADGSVQFIEMFSAFTGESALGGWTIKEGSNTFTFASNLVGDSANKWVLVATSNFASLPGAVTPDYVLPFSSFFPVGGGTLLYAGTADSWTYGAVPTDGVGALLRSGSTATNSPTNFAGQSGSVDLSATSVPALASWGIVLLVGTLLLAASGLLRRDPSAA